VTRLRRRQQKNRPGLLSLLMISGMPGLAIASVITDEFEKLKIHYPKVK
jgi:hypothetical protein